MSKRLWSWKTLTESVLVDPAQLLVDEAVLDGRRRAGGDALAGSPSPRGPNGRPSARGPSPRSAIVRPALRHRADEGEARRPRGARPGPGANGPLGTSASRRSTSRRPGGEAARRPQRGSRPPRRARRARRARPAARPSRSAAPRRGSPPPVSAEPRVVVRSRSEISSDIRFSRGGSRPSRRNSSSACWYWKTTGRRHGAGPASRAGLRLTRQQTLRRAARRNVTESMICPIRCTPRPPVRRSLA